MDNHLDRKLDLIFAMIVETSVSWSDEMQNIATEYDSIIKEMKDKE